VRKGFIIIILKFVFVSVSGQPGVQLGFLPKINLSVPISERLKSLNSIESRQIVLEDNEADLTHKFVLTEITTMLSIKTGANNALNAGYTLLLPDRKPLHRFLQQFNLVHRIERFRMGHRFAFDQTIGDDFPFDFRSRYRISIEMALSGLKVDPREFYLQLRNEYLWSYQSEQSDLEIRISPLLGYAINKMNKIEFGIDYRINEFVLSKSDHDFWITFIWYTSISSK
jgi:hypothetical protein